MGPAASDDLWFRIQTAAVSDMLHAMRFVHVWPPAADHLFEYSCAPTAVYYAPKYVSYSVSCAKGTEILKISFAPAAVTAGGKPLKQRGGLATAQDWYEYDAATGLLTVAHETRGDIVIVA